MKRTILLAILIFISSMMNAQIDEKEFLLNINDFGAKEISSDGAIIFWDFNDLDTSIIPYLIQHIDDSLWRMSSCNIAPYSSYIPSVLIGECIVKYIEKIVNPEFSFERITKNGKGYSLTVDDMIIIKELYEKWWQETRKSQQNPIGGSALNGTVFKWGHCPNVNN